MARRDPDIVFDWYFSDSSDESARADAISAKPIETRRLMDLVGAESIIHFALWSQLPNGHPVGELWLETNTDLLASIYLAYGGFFRQALSALRSWFELAVHGVFFSDHWKPANSRYKQWRQGKRNAPAKMKDIARSLGSRTDKLFNADEALILQIIEPVYSFLSEQTHGRGLDVHNLQDGRDNVPRYLEESFDTWYKQVMGTFDAVCFLYRIFFAREIGQYLASSKQESLRARTVSKRLSEDAPQVPGLVADALNASGQS